MVYFGENSDYIMCECETCKREIYVERESVAEEDAYAYHIDHPLKCSCGNIDEYINRGKKSCYHIKQELSALSDLLHKQQAAASRINAINAEMNKKFNPPTFWQSLFIDFIFSGKIFLIMLGAAIGLEVFLFIITLLMFFGGLMLGMEDLSVAGNELFYNLNIFRDRGGTVLSRFGFPADYPPFDRELAQEQIILGYVPYAIVGLVSVIFYVFLAIFIVRASVNIAKLTVFASKVMNQKVQVLRRREAYERELAELKREYNSLDVRIDELDIVGRDYKTTRATDMILKYFVSNRVDSIREAVNLYHDEDFKTKQVEYSKALYNELKQTRRYTKAMYMLTSDSNIKVEVRDDPPEPAAKPVKIRPAPKSPAAPAGSTPAGKISPPERKGAPEAPPADEAETVKSDPGKSETSTFNSIFDPEKSGGGAKD